MKWYGSMISSGRAKVRRLGVTKIAVPAARAPADLNKDALGIGHVLDRLDGEHAVEVVVSEGQVAHVGDVRLALLSGERLGIDVHADGLPRREQVVTVSDATPEVQDPPLREQRRAELVGSDVALPGRVEPAGWRSSPVRR